MDDKSILKSSVKKISFALITQGLILLCSLVTSLVVPKYMGTTQYGYWQIYYFYLNYINFITFGYNDGLLLKYGGKEHKELPIERIRSANIIMCIISILISIVGTGIISLIDVSSEIRFIYTILFLSMPLVCIFNIVLSFFLATNKQEVYNKVNLGSRFLATIGYCIMLFAGVTGYKSMIIVDFGVRVVIGIYCIFIGFYFINGKRDTWKSGYEEIWENCGSGIFITAGALLASFMPMAGRLVLQNNAPIEEYGIFAFALSILSLVITFTNAAGVVFFPIIKNLKDTQLIEYYRKIATVYDGIIMVALGVYVPAFLIIKYYLVDYNGVLEYMYLILALCIPLGKIQMIITPYMKALRMERQYFVANLVGAMGILSATYLIYQINRSVFSVALVTLIVFVIWSICLEIYLSNKMSVVIRFNLTIELIILLLFVSTTLQGQLMIFISLYIIEMVILAGIFFKKKNIIER